MTQVRFQVDRVWFRVTLVTAHIPIKFKCRFLVELKNSSIITNPRTLGQSKSSYRSVNSHIQFDPDEYMQFDSYLVYDNDLGHYRKKQVQLVVNLISDNRSDETKLVGRVKIDLNQFMIDNQGKAMEVTKQLENCSINKPEVARVTYRLQLVKEQKMEQQTLPIVEKQHIVGQVEKSLFSDNNQYSEFLRCVWGKDYNGSFSKLNKSALNSSQISTQSKGRLPVEGKEKVNDTKQVKQDKEQQQQIQQVIEEKGKQQVSVVQSKNQGQSKPSIKPLKVRKSVSFERQQWTEEGKDKLSQVQLRKLTSQTGGNNPIPNTNSISQSLVSSVANNNSISKSLQSSWKTIKRQPTQKSYHNSPRKMSRLQPIQGENNQFTAELFEEQELMIESLQQQIEQANEIIEQYRLELELVKEEVERLQGKRDKQQQQQNSLLLESQKEVKEKASQENINKEQQILSEQTTFTQITQINQLTAQNKRLCIQLQLQKQSITAQYMKIIAQKQEIIQSKDQSIKQLQQQIALVNLQFEQKMIEQDRVYDDLHQRIMELSEGEVIMKKERREMEERYKQQLERYKQKGLMVEERRLQELGNKLEAAEQQNISLKQTVSKQHKQANPFQRSLPETTSTAQLSQLICQREQQITHLKSTLEQQRTSFTQLQLRVSQLQSIAKQKDTELLNKIAIINRQQQKLMKLNEQYSRLQQQNNSSKQKYKQLQREKYMLSQQLANYNLNTITTDKLVEERTYALKTQLQQVNLSYAQSLNKISQLKFAVQSYQNQLQESQSTSKEKLSAMSKKMQGFIRKQTMFRQALQLLQQQSFKIQSYVERKEATLHQYQEQIIMKDEEILQKTDRLSYLQRKFRMSQNQIQELKVQLKMAQVNIGANERNDQEESGVEGEEGWRARMLVLTEANTHLLEKNKLLSQRIQQKQHTVYELTKQASSIDPLRRKISILQDQIPKYQSKIKQLNTLIKQQKQTIAQQQQSSGLQKQQLQHVYSQLQQLHDQLKTLQDEKIIVYGNLQERELEVVKLTGEVDEVRDELDRLRKHVQGKELQLQHANQLLARSESIEQQLTHKLRTLSSTDKESWQVSPVKQMLLSPTAEENTLQLQLQQQLQSYKHRQQSYMCNVLDLQQQLASLKEQNMKLAQGRELKASVNKSISNNSNNISNNSNNSNNISNNSNKDHMPIDKHTLRQVCDHLQRLIDKRIQTRQTENLLQILINNSEIYPQSEFSNNEQVTPLSQQKNTLQEQSRILSREVQKIKAVIFKKPQLSYALKTQIIQLLKPCQTITNELIKCVDVITKETDSQNISQV